MVNTEDEGEGRKLIKQGFLFVCLLFILTGCWDMREAEQLSYVTAIGIDLPENNDNRQKQHIEVTFQFANPREAIKGTEGKSSPEENIVTLEAPDFITAKNMANSFVARQISFNHTRALIVSEKFAKTDLFFEFMTAAVKEREIRREISIIVSKEKASEFIYKLKPELGMRPHKYFQFILDRSVETGLVPKSNLNRFMNITDGDADLFLAIYGSSDKGSLKEEFKLEDDYLAGQIPKKGGNPVQLMGSAVFMEGKMIGKLTGEETRLALLLDKTSNIEDMFVTYPDPEEEDKLIGARVRKKTSTEVKIKLGKGSPKIDVMLPLEIEIVSVPSMVSYGDTKEIQEKLEASIEDAIKKKITKLIERTQEEFKAEPFYWSLHVRPLFSSVKEYENADWNKKIYPYADIDVTVDVVLIGFGKQIKESELEKVRD